MKIILLVSTLIALASSTAVLPIKNMQANAPRDAPSSISAAGTASTQTTPTSSPPLPPGVADSVGPQAPASSSSPNNTGTGPTMPPVHRGFNVPAWQGGQNTPLKQQSDWITAFNRIKTVGNGFHAARVYATQEGDGKNKLLPDILAAANETDTLVLVGIYLGANDNGARFSKEFAVLKEAIDKYGCKNIIGIAVGNEDLYQASIKSLPLAPAASSIASQIQQVQSYLDQSHPDSCVPVGHVDTWTWTVNPLSAPITKISDFLVANIFPYWENSTITTVGDYFSNALTNITSYEKANDIEVWIGETGWPMTPAAGGAFQGVAGKEGMQTYWQQIVCGKGFQERNAFYYADKDDGDTPGWGVFDANGGANIDFRCGPV